MQRDELARLSKAELIELVLRMQRPEKTSRTSSKPPSTDRKARREQLSAGLPLAARSEPLPAPPVPVAPSPAMRATAGL
jgi:hypothetical protein